MIETELKCTRCGKVFSTQYGDGGSIQHDNHTNERNLNIYYKRGEILDEINFDNDNYCNIKNITTFVAEEMNKCRLIWLKEFDIKMYDKAVQMLNDRNVILERILNGCDKDAKYHFKFYWTRANRLIKCLKYCTKIEIKKVLSTSKQVTYIAETETGIIVLDLEKD